MRAACGKLFAMRPLVFGLVGLLVATLLFRYWMRRGRVSGDDARRLVERGALLVDVRTPGEFAGGHVGGATNVPLQELAARIGELGDPARAIVVYCHSGMRSRMAATLLRRSGFTGVADLGPRSAWPS